VALTIRRLTTPAVQDVVTNAMIQAGPAVDNEAEWKAYRNAHPDCRYAVAKRVLSHRASRRHGLSNLPADAT
jgi:hypothetical protein